MLSLGEASNTPFGLDRGAGLVLWQRASEELWAAVPGGSAQSVLSPPAGTLGFHADLVADGGTFLAALSGNDMKFWHMGSAWQILRNENLNNETLPSRPRVIAHDEDHPLAFFAVGPGDARVLRMAAYDIPQTILSAASSPLTQGGDPTVSAATGDLAPALARLSDGRYFLALPWGGDQIRLGFASLHSGFQMDFEHYGDLSLLGSPDDLHLAVSNDTALLAIRSGDQVSLKAISWGGAFDPAPAISLPEALSHPGFSLMPIQGVAGFWGFYEVTGDLRWQVFNPQGAPVGALQTVDTLDFPVYSHTFLSGDQPRVIWMADNGVIQPMLFTRTLSCQ